MVEMKETELSRVEEECQDVLFCSARRGAVQKGGRFAFNENLVKLTRLERLYYKSIQSIFEPVENHLSAPTYDTQFESNKIITRLHSQFRKGKLSLHMAAAIFEAGTTLNMKGASIAGYKTTIFFAFPKEFVILKHTFIF